MRLAIFLTAVALLPASAQPGAMKQAPPPPAPVGVKPAGSAAVPEQSPVTLKTLDTLEKQLDGQIGGANPTDPCVALGSGMHGLYINGLGAIFTGEVDLINSPTVVGLFGPALGPEQKAGIHKRKQANVAVLQQTMRTMVLWLASSPALKLADTDQVVVAVRLLYRPWEDTTGLPGQIVMRIDRRGGIPKMEVQ
jgi:hypothetical protein